jgi:uncharacterized membrane protein (DUF485 family)
MDQERLAWSLTLALVGLSALFVVLSAGAPDFMARPFCVHVMRLPAA